MHNCIILLGGQHYTKLYEIVILNIVISRLLECAKVVHCGKKYTNNFQLLFAEIFSENSDAYHTIVLVVILYACLYFDSAANDFSYNIIVGIKYNVVRPITKTIARRSIICISFFFLLQTLAQQVKTFGVISTFYLY